MAAGDFKLKKARLERQKEDAIQTALDYYVGHPEVPFDRIASHLGLPLGDVISEMKRRGRTE